MSDAEDPIPKADLPANLDGLSFYPQLTGKKAKTRDWVFCDYDPRWGKAEHRTYVHNKDLKLYTDGKIYNVRQDPDELKPLTRAQLKPAELKVVQEFDQVLASKMGTKN